MHSSVIHQTKQNITFRYCLGSPTFRNSTKYFFHADNVNLMTFLKGFKTNTVVIDCNKDKLPVGSQNMNGPKLSPRQITNCTLQHASRKS